MEILWRSAGGRHLLVPAALRLRMSSVSFRWACIIRDKSSARPGRSGLERLPRSIRAARDNDILGPQPRDTPTGTCEESDECIHTGIVTYVLILYSANMSTLPDSPLPRLASIDRSQLLLHTVDVERLIDEDHSARSIWQLLGRLNPSLYHAEIAALEGSTARDHTAPQLLICL